MESSAPVHLAGSEIHGFHTIKDLDVWKIMEDAKQRWLRPNEIHAILYNSNFFDIYVRPVDLPPSGTIALFDRKMLRNFRKDGHNWKKKKDGKTIKEAHEHLKVGNEERIHVYYAHGEDNPSFVRRCYWLLDKTREHIVLVHYRETSELQGSPVTPVDLNSGTTRSGTSVSWVLSGQTDAGADHHASCSDSGTSLINESIELGDNVNVSSHEITVHDINTLEWDELLVENDPNSFTAPKRDDISCLEQWNQHEVNDSIRNVSILPCNNKSEDISSFGHSIEPVLNSCSLGAKLQSSGCFQTMENQTGSNVQRKEFEMVSEVTNDTLDIVKDGLQAQDSFGTWINYILTDSPGLSDNQQVATPISTGHESSAPAQSSIQEQIFSINDISPAWAFSTEQTKVIVIGYFHGAMSLPAESNFFFVFGDSCVPAEMVQVGVFRCMALPHSPGLVNFYLSLDGHTPISEVITFEYRSSSIEGGVTLPDDKSKWEEFQVQIRLARMLFSMTDSLNILSTGVSQNALKEAKKFVRKTSSTDKEWAYLIKSIGNSEISFPQAKNKLFEITLKNKLLEWLLGRVVEGGKTKARDRQGQGIIHLCAILGYTWAVRPYADSGLSIDFRDSHGWTALHWAAYHGREKMVAVLLSAGADPSLVTDPTSEFPGGCVSADLASKNGYDGLAAYLAEKGLTEHFRRMALSGNISGSLQTSTTDLVNPGNLSEEQLCQKESLAAYRQAADVASRIQAAFRENSLRQQTKAAQISNPEDEARGIIAALKIQHAYRNYESRKRMKAAARIQHRFRTWQIRKEFLNMRRQVIKIQAAFRGHRARKQYDKILWSVGVLEKAILRWRLKRKGIRGLQSEPTMTIEVDQEKESNVEDFFQISQKQAEERINRSVVRVQALFRSYRAQQEYRRMKMTYDQTQLEELFEPEV